MKSRNGLRISIFLFLLVSLAASCLEAQSEDSSTPVENWDFIRMRRWVGPNLWANRLEDWEIRDGFLMPTNGDPDFPVRTVYAITREVLRTRGSYFLSVDLSSEVKFPHKAKVGFLIGAGSGLLDWRAAALVHSNSGKGGGILAFLELDTAPRLTFRDMSCEYDARAYRELAGQTIGQDIVFPPGAELRLTLEVKPAVEEGRYELILALFDAATGETLAQLALPGRPESDVLGSFALAFSPLQKVSRPTIRLRNFRAWGDKLIARPERAFGPVMGTLYTVAGGVLKMTAQFAPVAHQGDGRSPEPLKAYLEIENYGTSADRGWWLADSARITDPDFTARFRVEGWKSDSEKKFRVVYKGQDGGIYYYEGTIATEPGLEDDFSLAAFTGMGLMGRNADSGPALEDKGPFVGRWTPANVWFPFEQTVSNLAAHKVDLLCFTGDQIYEYMPTSIVQHDRFPVYDYLYKWYLWHWAFSSLTRHRPSVCQPDDHDVYQGNIWGWEGRLNMTGRNSDGGYMRDPLFLRLVERTQVSHLPDPYDSTPILNDIGVYYTGFSYGGVSFAVLEDRKFKSSRRLVEESQARLLGERQLEFLDEWATDWRKATMKVILSQGTYASVQTDSEGEIRADMDTGGWPKKGRDRALRAFRKARVLIVCGDQHLSTLVRMGIDTFTDGPVQFCVPALGNVFWRWFYPRNSGSGPLADPQGYTGDFKDGFGNRFRMLAAANPTDVKFMGDRGLTLRRWNSRGAANVDSVRLCQGDGVGIVRLNKKTRTYRIECWPYNVMPNLQGQGQYNGWPASFTQADMDGREVKFYLSEVEFPVNKKICVAVYNENSGLLVYSYPLMHSGEVLSVYEEGKYRILLYDPDKPEVQKSFTNIMAKSDRIELPVLEFGF